MPLLPPPLPPQPPLPVRALDLGLLLVLTIAGVVALPVAVSLIWPDIDFTALSAVLGLFVAQSLLMMGLTWLVVLRPHRLGLADIGLRPADRGWYRLAVAVGLACVPAVALINYALQELTGGPVDNPQLEALAPEGFSWTSLAAMLLLVGVLVPFIEEVIFRGLVLGWLRKHLRFVYAAPISALLFSVVHGIPDLMPALAVMGLVLAAMKERSGSLWPSIIVHGVFNALMTITYYTALASAAGF